MQFWSHERFKPEKRKSHFYHKDTQSLKANSEKLLSIPGAFPCHPRASLDDNFLSESCSQPQVPAPEDFYCSRQRQKNKQTPQSSLFGSCMILISSEKCPELLSAEKNQTTNNAHFASEQSFWEILN